MITLRIFKRYHLKNIDTSLFFCWDSRYGFNVTFIYNKVFEQLLFCYSIRDFYQNANEYYYSYLPIILSSKVYISSITDMHFK